MMREAPIEEHELLPKYSSVGINNEIGEVLPNYSVMEQVNNNASKNTCENGYHMLLACVLLGGILSNSIGNIVTCFDHLHDDVCTYNMSISNTTTPKIGWITPQDSIIITSFLAITSIIFVMIYLSPKCICLFKKNSTYFVNANMFMIIINIFWIHMIFKCAKLASLCVQNISDKYTEKQLVFMMNGENIYEMLFTVAMPGLIIAFINLFIPIYVYFKVIRE